MIIHFHHSLTPNSGDVKRISNIDKEFSYYYNDKTIEVVFCPSRKLKRVRGVDFFKLSDNTIKKICVPLIPRANRINTLYESFILGILCLFYQPKVIIGEMFFSKKLVGLLRLLCPEIKIFADIHGAVVDENLYVNPLISKKDLERIRDVDRYTTKSADYVICQSDEMKKYIVNNYGVCTDNICVYRCGYDPTLFKLDSSSRKTIRQTLGVKDDEILFVYSGGLHKWQKVDESLRLFKNYQLQHGNSKMLILTGDNNILMEMIEQEEFKSVKDYIVTTSVPFQLVPRYLNACDIAFLLRDNHMMNAVASPTKLAEYFACGLPVISTEVSKFWVDEIAYNYLIMAEHENIYDNIKDSISTVDKNSISMYAINHLSLDIDHRVIFNFLQSLENVRV